MVDIVEFKKIPNTDRACAIVINCRNASVLYINMDMPVDTQMKTHIEPEFLDTLEAVDMYIEQCNIRH